MAQERTVRFYLEIDQSEVRIGIILGFVRVKGISLPERYEYEQTMAIIADIFDGKLHEVSLNNVRYE